MECAECARLGTRRELLEARYARILALLSASAVGGIVSAFLENRKAAQKAKMDLDDAAEDLRRHRDTHARKGPDEIG